MTNVTKHYRLDRGNVTKAQITDEGFLKAHAIVTRAGVFEYVNPDGSLRLELRHPQDVFNPDSLKSMQMRPITNGHPSQKLVNADNAKDLVVGYTGESVNVNSPYISTTLLVTDKKAISDINSKKKFELSLGYNVDLLEEKGEFEGQPYTHRQTNIRYNHLAIVDKGRAGPEARIHLDANDAIEVDSVHNDYENIEFKKEIDMSDDKFTTVNVDGLSYKSAPEVAKALEKAQKRADDLNNEVLAYKNDVEKLKAEKDALNQQIADAKKINVDEMVKAGVMARIALIEDVKSIMGKKSAEFKFDSMTDKEMISKTVKDKCPSVNVDSVSEVYLQARFDMLKEAAIEAQTKESKSFADQRGQVVTKVDAKDCSGDKVEDARKKMMERLLTRQDMSKDAANAN